jgi:hypothetical protein
MTVQERLEEESKQRIIQVAEKMLKGGMHFVEGSRLICSLRMTIAHPDPDDPIYDVFVMIKYETHDIPLQVKEQSNYSALLKRAHEKIEEYVFLLKPVIEVACENIIVRMSEDESKPVLNN